MNDQFIQGVIFDWNKIDDDSYLKQIEALKDVANGEANKVFIPFEATSALGSLGAIKEVVKDEKKK